VRLVALGDGPGVEPLRDAGAKVVVSATGIERARCTATFDVLVQPRKKEVYAPTVLEALASGVPVVAFETGVASRVVVDGHNGLLVEADRGGASLARAVARLAVSPDLRYALAEQARDSVSHRTWRGAVAELVDEHYLRATRSSLVATR
jgi:glycosyltransferase involved in cell wall biosynthesis